jgi:hypothetical protein
MKIKTSLNTKKSKWKGILGIVLFLILSIGAYYLPPVHSRLSWRVEEFIARVKFTISPPEQTVFLPSQLAQTEQRETVTSFTSPTSNPLSVTSTPRGPTPTTTITFTPLPAFISLPNVVYVDQKNRWNYCGPANLTMALKYWGWTGTRDDVAAVVKPGIQDMSLDFIQRGKSDKNVMPYELTDFVQEYTDFNVVLRYGGDVNLLKRMVAAGFPVVVEKGYYEKDYTGRVDWLGHYQFVTGYEDEVQSLIVQDTWNDGPNFRIPYDEFTDGWRSFDYIFFIVYPPERDAEIIQLLGTWADPVWGYQYALDLAEQEIQSMTSMDLFFAWFNKGTSLVKLGRFNEAALAYDFAFNYYATLETGTSQLQYRLMWYQTGPYMAYYYSGRYGDLITLATFILDNPRSTPTEEESFYWRGMAQVALGQTSQGIEDLRESVRLNPNFTAGLQSLQDLGVQP